MKQLLGALAICVALTASANAQDLFTNFTDGTISGSDFTTNGTGLDATFGAPGQVVFFNNGSLYSGSNRAYGVGVGASSEITLSTVATVTAVARNTSGQTTGPSTAGSVAPGTTLGTAIGSLEAFDVNDVSLGVFNFTDGGFTSFDFSGQVSRLTLTNTSTDADSFALLGSISAVAVPEPSSGLLIAGVTGLLALRRRRR